MRRKPPWDAPQKREGEFRQLAWVPGGPRCRGGESVPYVMARGLLFAWWERGNHISFGGNPTWNMPVEWFFFLRVYLFFREREREKGREGERERNFDV